MKYLLSFLILILLTGSVYSQIYRQAGLDEFEGKWEYSDASQTFTLQLQKNEAAIPGIDGRFEMIEGHVSYVLDGKTIIEKIEKKPSIKTGGLLDKENPNSGLQFLFYDAGKSKNVNGTLELMEGKTDEAVWTIRNTEGVRVSKYDYSFSVPKRRECKVNCVNPHFYLG